MDIKHVLSLNPLEPVYAGSPSPVVESDALGCWVERGRPGRDRSPTGSPSTTSCPSNQVFLQPFRLAQPPTNAEWAAFMADGGYARPELWLSDGWARVKAEGWRAPFYWTSATGSGSSTPRAPRPVNPGLLVSHVSHYEADAYATWAGKEAPTGVEVSTASVRQAAR